MRKTNRLLSVISISFLVLFNLFNSARAADFKREVIYQIVIDRFFDGSTTNNTWTDFDNLVTAAHQSGIKIIVDFAPNHSTTDNAGEFGALYDNGTFVGNYTSDTNGYFHHNGNISNFDDRYQLQYYALFDLADLNQENATIDAYLKAAAQQFQQHGVDGFRIDAVKHATWGWEYSFANSIYTYGDSFLFGEWYQGNTNDPLYHDPYNRPMMSAFDTTTTAYKLTGTLSTLRHNNPAIPYGSTGQRWMSSDVYI